MLRARFERTDSSTFAAKARRLFESGASHGAMKLTLGAVAVTSGAFMFTTPAVAACAIVGAQDYICDASAPNPDTSNQNLVAGAGEDNDFYYQAGHISTGTMVVTTSGDHLGVNIEAGAVIATANGD